MKEQNFFFGKLDLDTTVELISKENQSYAINIIRGPEKSGNAKTFYGNRQISYTPPTGNNTVIGSGVDIQTNSIVAFIHNSNNDHQIVQVLPTSETVEVILGPKVGFDTAWLGFDLSRLITHVNVFNGNLTFVEGGYIGPYHIDIDAAKGFMTSATATSETFVYPAGSFSTDERKIQSVRAIKYLPTIRPTISYITSTAKQTNYLKYKTWQVACRYIYFDNSYSAMSPYSDVLIPPNEDTSIGTNDTVSINNGLRVTIDTGHPNVKNIEICFRNGNTGQFYTIDKLIRKYDEDNQATAVGDYQTHTFDWFGEDVGYPIGVDELLNYDAVPYRAKTQSFLHNNRLVYGNYDIDYDSTAIDVSIAKTSTVYGTKPVIYGFDLDLSAPGSATDIIRIPATSAGISAGDIIYFLVQDSLDSSYAPDDTWDYPYSYTIKASDLTGYPTSLRDSLIALGDNIPSTFSAGATNQEVKVTPPSGRFSKFFSFDCYKIQDKKISWKKGSRPEFSISYYDECGRNGPGNTSLDSRVYIPWYSEDHAGQDIYNDNGASGILTTNWFVELEMTINHVPPSWAKFYQINYGGNGLAFYIQGKGEIITANEALDADITILDVESFVDKISDNKRESYEYEFQKGDRIRLISDIETIFNTYEDHKVLSFDPGTKTLTLESGSIGLFQGTFEIYRPTPETKSQIHRELSGLIPITNGYHTGGVQTQASGVPAKQKINGGDTYIYDRLTEHIVYFKTLASGVPDDVARTDYHYKQESMHISDFYSSNDFSFGKLILVDNNSKSQTITNEIIHGGVYAKNSNINEVFKFNPLNTTQVDFANGAIIAMRTIGRTLKVLQEYNSSSVYIEQSYINQGENRVLSFVDSVFGYTEPSSNNWGTKNPESVYVNDRHLFFYDTENRSIVRDAPNGQFVISDYNAASWFRDEGNVQANIHLYYDGFNNLLICTVGERTISFIDDGSNRWNAFHSFVPESASSVNRHLIAFKDGIPYIFSNTAKYGEYFGIQYPSVVRVTANQQPSETKSYQNIEMKSSTIWYAPEDGDISVNNGKKISRLIETKFREKDGMYFAEFMRDINTPNVSPTESILEGRRLIGNHLTIDLQVTSDTEEEIFSVTIHSVPSKKSD